MANDRISISEKIAALESAGIYDLVDSKCYVNMFYARLCDFHDEVIELARIARKKRTPSRYFAKSLGVNCLTKTISWLRGMLERAKSKAREAKIELTKIREDEIILREREKNVSKISQYDLMVGRLLDKKHLSKPVIT